MNKKDIINLISKYEFNSNKYMVLSGSAMVLYDIKKTTDNLDIAVDEDYFGVLLKLDNLVIKHINDNLYVIDDAINVNKNCYNKNDIVYINDIPVQRIKKIIDFKKILNRPKDILDLSFIDKYLNKNSLVLAYLGDSIYEVYIRKYLISKNIYKVEDLNREATKYASAKGQASFLKNMLENNFLNDNEIEIVKRARNHKSRSPKNTDIVTYKNATGLEALIGYLELNHDDARIKEIMDFIISL